MAREVAKDGILVNSVAPGPIETDMVAGITPEWKKAKKDSLPLGRFGLAKEVAPLGCFFGFIG